MVVGHNDQRRCYAVVRVAQHVVRDDQRRLRTLHLGPEELLVAAKVAVDPQVSVADVARAIDEAEARVRAAVPIAQLIYIEPDVQRP